MKTLILITNTFPYGLPESSFLREEIKYLREKFRLVIIARNTVNELYVPQPVDVTLYRYDANREYNPLFLSILSLCQKDFYKELVNCKRQCRLGVTSVIKILRFMMRSLHFSKYLNKITTRLTNSDIIYYTYWNDYATYSCVTIKKNNQHVVSRLHGGDLYKLSINGYYLPFKDITNEKVDKLIFISEAGERYYNSTYKNQANKSCVCRLGVLSRTKKAQFLKRSSLKLVSFSYVRDIKRIDLIIDTLALIDNIEIEWVHIGAGYIFDKVLQYAHEKLDSRSNIRFEFKGSMKNEDALDYISSIDFDFLLNTSSTEGLPMTMMEAMSMGIPVIGTDVGGVKEIIINGYNGYLLDVNFNLHYLANLLSEYSYLSYEDKLTFRNNALKTWKERYNESVNFRYFVNDILLRL